MPVLSAIFLVAALILAVVIGPQTRPWTWGPAMLALGFAVSAALPVLWKNKRTGGDFGLIAFGALVGAWFAWRAWISPVAELGQADIMLLAGVCGTFISIRAIEGNTRAEQLLVWGIALLLLANVMVVGKQILDPEFSPIFGARTEKWPTGFYAQYNEAANYLIASSLLVAAAALFGQHGKATRILFILIVIGGLAAVFYTRSRGGILGAAVGFGVFAGVALIIGKRRKARWYIPTLFAMPVIGLGIIVFLFSGWQSSQELRHLGGRLDQLMDNNCRLYFLGMAMSCIGLHPMAGGGGRSFSWESFRFADGKAQGDTITHIPEQVHNELVQAATDYGIIGAALLAGLLGALIVGAVVRILFAEATRESPFASTWRLGALAAFAGMFIQSCFSFVFHLFPGVLLLGICLGQMSRTTGNVPKTTQMIGTRILLCTAAVVSAMFLITLGCKGTHVTWVLWSSYFSKQPNTVDESRIDALTEAIRIWPQSLFYQDRAAIFQTMASTATDASAIAPAEQAVRDYEQAEQLHPFNPSPTINRANTLSQLFRNTEAEKAYDQAIYLQGGMEPAYRGHFSLANHLMRKGIRQFSSGDPSVTLASMEIAAQQMDEAVKEMHWITPDMREPMVFVHENLGAAREANSDFKGALQEYDYATTLRFGTRAHYRAGVLMGKMAASAWAGRRPAEALGYFMEARRRIGLASELPRDITPSQRIEYLDYLDKTIEYLKGAKIEPLDPSLK